MNYIIKKIFRSEYINPKNIHGFWLSIFRKKKKTNMPEKKLKDGGFIAWPKSEAPQLEEKPDKGIRVGRTKDGGYIAFPK